jgi:hypothetical protein
MDPKSITEGTLQYIDEDVKLKYFRIEFKGVILW